MPESTDDKAVEDTRLAALEAENRALRQLVTKAFPFVTLARESPLQGLGPGTDPTTIKEWLESAKSAGCRPNYPRGRRQRAKPPAP